MLVITQDNLEKFLGELKKKFDVFSAQGGSASGGDVLPFKKYFFPPIEEIFFTDKKGNIKINKPPQKFVLFGLDSFDLEALTQLDEIMSKPKEDFYYWQRRKQGLVIGIEKDMQKLARDYGDFFEVSDIGCRSESDWQNSMRQLLLDSELLSDAVKWSHNHKIWEDLAQRCLGCGICTYVCPLCHCFSIEDRVDLDDKCSRCRKWDACTLPGFAKIAGGHSFRPTLKERYYNWFYHKFVRAYKEYGKSQCVGCGRCKKYCPAQIDIQEVLKNILEEYKKENG